MARTLLVSIGGCRTCEGWGPVGYDGRCPRCLVWDRPGAGRVTGRCRRCDRTTRVDYAQVCRPCLVEIRYADEQWVLAEREQRSLPPRELQLALVLPDLTLPRMEPLTKRRGPALRLLPRTHGWELTHPPALPTNDPRVCPPQIPGQLGLLRLPRRLGVSHGRRIRGRQLPEHDRIEAAARRLQQERGHGSAWRWALMPLVRLAVAAREPDEDLVREEDLDQLSELRGPAALVLREAGLLRDRTTPKPPTPRRRMPGPRRERRPNVSGYRPVPPPPAPPRSCTHCLAWTGTARTRCEPCRSFSSRSDCGPGLCVRCGRALPLVAGRCRLCTIAVALGSPEQTVQDQLWLLPMPVRPSLPVEAPAPEVVSEHLIAAGQEALFAPLTRDWAALLDRPLPALTPDAQRLIDAFDRRARDEQWNKGTRLANLRVLRIALAHLGADAPLAELDLRALAKLRTNFSGLRVAQFLDTRGLLIAAPGHDVGMDEAAVTRLAATVPACFRGDVDVWIRVLRGQGRRPSPAKEWTTVRRYLGYVLPVLADWSHRFASLREITAQDVKTAIEARPGASSRSVHAGLRSLFRALKRERVIFHDPARAVHLTAKVSVPRAVPSDKIAGMLDKVPSAFGKLCVALVAIHAVRPLTLPALLTSDLDRAHGRLRAGGRIVYLDELTAQLIADWIGERHRQWPQSTNPHLLVSRRTAMDVHRPPITKFTVVYQFRFTGLNAQQVWSDRILDEAHGTEDPIHLMRVFGLSATTAVKYVQTAHAERCIVDPTQA